MRRILTRVCFAVFVCLVAGAGTAVSAPILVNPDFQTGTFAGWTQFVTTEGSTDPSIASFDVDDDAAGLLAARFRVGDTALPIGTQEGGGIYQSFVSGNETLNFSADIAAFYSFTSGQNAAAGFFSLIVDGITLATIDLGVIDAQETLRSTLFGTTTLTAGTHELRLLITRPYLASGVTQYIDDVAISSVASVPEPASLTLLGLGLAGMGVRRWRQRKAA